MKAYHFESPAAGLVPVDLPDPVPAPGHVVLDVEAAGMCQSDVHILNRHGDDWLRKRPIVLATRSPERSPHSDRTPPTSWWGTASRWP